MELWELVAREAIRDLVARYNANGDTGRFEHLIELFADDAEMETANGHYRGKSEIMTIFTGVREHLHGQADATSEPPTYVRHNTSTLQIDLIDPQTAKSRCYYTVITRVGIDHWGRYIDEYKVVDGAWKFARRQVTTEGRSTGSLFPHAD